MNCYAFTTSEYDIFTLIKYGTYHYKDIDLNTINYFINSNLMYKACFNEQNYNIFLIEFIDLNVNAITENIEIKNKFNKLQIKGEVPCVCLNDGIKPTNIFKLDINDILDLKIELGNLIFALNKDQIQSFIDLHKKVFWTSKNGFFNLDKEKQLDKIKKPLNFNSKFHFNANK